MDLRFLYWRSRTGSQSHFFDDVLTFQARDIPSKGHVKLELSNKSVTMCYPQKLAEVCIHRNSQTPTRRSFLMKSQVSCQSSKRSCQEVSWQGGIGIRHHSDCSIGQILACTHLYLNMYLRYQNLGLNCNQEFEIEINSSKVFRFFRCILDMKKNSPMNSVDFVFIETCMRYHEI